MNHVSFVGNRACTLFAPIPGGEMRVGSLVCLLTVFYYCISLCSVMSCDAHCLPAFACEEAAQAREQSLTKVGDEASHNILCTQWREDFVEACDRVHAEVQETQCRYIIFEIT